MQLGRCMEHNRVRRKERMNQTSEIHVTVDLKVDSFGVLSTNDTVYFESGVIQERLGGMVVPATTAVDDVVREPADILVLP